LLEIDGAEAITTSPTGCGVPPDADIRYKLLRPLREEEKTID
jgi:hypothetical protein